MVCKKGYLVVEVRLFGHLRSYCKQDCLNGLKSTVREKATVNELLLSIGIPKEEEIILTINGVYNPKGKDIELEQNDKIEIYPIIAAG